MIMVSKIRNIFWIFISIGVVVIFLLYKVLILSLLMNGIPIMREHYDIANLIANVIDIISIIIIMLIVAIVILHRKNSNKLLELYEENNLRMKKISRISGALLISMLLSSILSGVVLVIMETLNLPLDMQSIKVICGSIASVGYFYFFRLFIILIIFSLNYVYLLINLILSLLL